MLAKFMRTTAFAATTLAGATAAQADVTTTIEQDGLSSGLIEVISENGTEWTTIRDSELILRARVFAGISDSYAAEYGSVSYSILQGSTVLRSGNSGNPLSDTFDLQTNTANLILDRFVILRLCNDKLNIGDGINQDHSDTAEIALTLQTGFHKDQNLWEELFEFDSSGADYRPEDVSGTFQVPVICRGVPPEQESTVAFKVSDLSLSLKSFTTQTTQPNPGTVCRKGQLKVLAKTTKTGPVRLKLWTKVGNGPLTPKIVNAWASEDGNGGFRAEHTEWISVSKTGQVQAKAEEMVNPVGLTTPWKTTTLNCTNPGGGGFTADLPNHDDPVPAANPFGNFTNNSGGDPVKPQPPSNSGTFGANSAGSGDGTNVVGDPPRHTCVGGKVVVATSMPPKYLCKCKKQGWTPVVTGKHSWKCVNKGNSGGNFKFDKSKLEAEKAKRRREAIKAAQDAAKRRNALKAAQEAAKRRRALQDTVNRRATLRVVPNGTKRPNGLQDTLNRRATLRVVPNGGKRPKTLQDTLNRRATIRIAPNTAKRRVQRKRRAPASNAQIMLQRRR